MTKQEVQKRVLKNGEPLDSSLFEWDEKTNTFSSNENYLVLDFGGIYNYTFKTDSDCTFNTGYNCTFNTGSHCIFNTGSHCIFNTGSDCTFKTGSDCVIVRRDIYEVIELNGKGKIKLSDYGIRGYTSIKENEVIELTLEQIAEKFGKKVEDIKIKK